MAVQKKRTSISNISKKRIRKNILKMKGYRAAIKNKSFFHRKSLSTGNSKSFFVQQTSKKVLEYSKLI
uniref:Ribosomal protein L32 n=1 Tax=Jeffersonia diphylla TaxID=46961 RepID=A0A7M3UKT7_JEFDI|nr:ribosomal protein L32 [Jeffersonia diphylla]QOI12507.1 ribosomal protein L32 [Jeffersonia diphylla]